VPTANVIVGIDLADQKQMVVVCDHDSKVLARKTFRCRAWDLGRALDWAAERRMPFVCVQPSVTAWSRRAEDLTPDKTDDKDAVLIARLTAQLPQLRTRAGGRGLGAVAARITRRVFTALTDPAGVHPRRAGALERVALLLQDWQHAHTRLADTETRMLAVLEEPDLTELVTSIPGISALGAATILAQTGDPRRFATARVLVKHAGLAPREKLSGSFVGRAKLTGQGRPGLRVAAWRAVWGAQRANPVYAARYAHLTSREKTS
jgi:transposase